jgi:hypothetical protein
MGRGPDHEVALVAPSSPGEWEDACAAFSDATAFHRYDFLQAVAPPLRCRFVPRLVVFQGRPAGVAPLLVKQLGPFCTINWAPFPYLGPLVPSALIPATLSALAREARRRRAVNHQQSFSYVLACGPAGGFTSHTDRTFVIPLGNRSDDDLLAAMQHGGRRHIRRAQRAGLEVGPAEAEDVRLMDAWLNPVFAAQGLRTPYRPGTYSRIFAALRNAPGAVFYAARRRGRTVGVEVVFATARRAFAWQAAVDPAHRSHYPQALLTWHALLWARGAGAAEFDLVGAPNEGIATYKRRLGGVERHFTVLHSQARLHRSALRALSRVRSGRQAG